MYCAAVLIDLRNPNQALTFIFELKTGTLVTPALENVYANFVFKILTSLRFRVNSP